MRKNDKVKQVYTPQEWWLRENLTLNELQ